MTDRARAPTPLGPAPRPEQIAALEPEEADALLDELEATVPVRPGLATLAGLGASEAVVFGDSHGDWRSSEAPVARFLEAPGERCLVGLGDYVDRAPEDCEGGSVANAMWLLGLAARYPDRVFLLVGNHDLSRRIPALPHDLPEEVDLLWGPDVSRYNRLLGLLERGPLAALSGNGVYFAHAGFPRGPPVDWRERIDHASEETLIDLTWSDCSASMIDRGLGQPFDEAELRRFLEKSGSHVFLRGHDPMLTGRPLYHRSMLTLQTTRTYARFGGVIYAVVPLDRPVASTDDLEVVHASSESGLFPVA